VHIINVLTSSIVFLSYNTISQMTSPSHAITYSDITNVVGSSWSWSHGSWIYNYLCKQCLSPL